MGHLARRFRAIFLQRCPKCLCGKVFTGSVKMAPACPVCGHPFEREPGYFLGAMYVSYFLSIPLLGLFTWLVGWLLLPTWPFEWVAPVAALPYLFLMPLVFRYSRIIWMHLDAPPPEGAAPHSANSRSASRARSATTSSSSGCRPRGAARRKATPG